MKEYFQGWFYRKHIAVIAFHENSIRLIELKKQRRGIKCIKVLEHSLKSGMSENGTPEFGLLKYLAAEFTLTRLKTIIHLPQYNLRHHFLKLPAGFNGNMEEWLNQNTAQFLPPGLPKNQIIYGYNHIRNAEDSGAVLLTIAKLDTIKKWTDVFIQLQLRIACVNGNYFPVQSCFAFLDDTFFQENRAFLHFDTHAVFLLITKKGIPGYYKEFLRSHSQLKSQSHANDVKRDGIEKESKYASIIEELNQFKNEDTLHQIIITGEGVDQNCYSDFKKTAKVKFGGELIQNLIPAGNANRYVHLFGLGIQSLYGQFETCDLRQDEYRQEMNEREQQIQTIHFAGYSGLILISIWLIVMATNFLVKFELGGWEKEVTQLDTKIKQIEELKNTGEELSSQLMLQNNLFKQRSQLANLLFDISRIMPEGVWLRTIRYGQTKDADNAEDKIAEIPIIIEGLALAQSGPTKLLSEMEELSYLEQVQLDLMQSIPAEVVLKKTKLRRIPLFKFQLSVWKNISG